MLVEGPQNMFSGENIQYTLWIMSLQTENLEWKRGW